MFFLFVSNGQEQRTAVVVGAGPAGCLMSHYLFQRGNNVHDFSETRCHRSPKCPSNSEVASCRHLY